MAQCNHGNPYRTAPDAVINSLPECQAGTGRHKCAVCAYNEGLLAADGKVFLGPAEQCPHEISVPRDMLSALPVSQGGPHRHACVYAAYRKGLEAGKVASVVTEFEAENAKLDKTEEMALQKVRIGQQIFRRELLKFWNEKCPLTGITDTSLLTASHIKSWARCDSDAERLNVYNGILLSSLHDAAFDAGLMSFEDNGQAIYSDTLSGTAKALLSYSSVNSITFSEAHLPYLNWHRATFFG